MMVSVPDFELRGRGCVARCWAAGFGFCVACFRGIDMVGSSAWVMVEAVLAVLAVLAALTVVFAEAVSV